MSDFGNFLENDFARSLEPRKVHAKNSVNWLLVGIMFFIYTWDLGLKVECPSWGVFLKNPRPYLHKFQRKPLKTPHG